MKVAWGKCGDCVVDDTVSPNLLMSLFSMADDVALLLPWQRARRRIVNIIDIR